MCTFESRSAYCLALPIGAKLVEGWDVFGHIGLPHAYGVNYCQFGLVVGSA